MCKRIFICLIAFVMCSLLAFVEQALAITYNFNYDNSVSAARNKVAEYAYEI